EVNRSAGWTDERNFAFQYRDPINFVIRQRAGTIRKRELSARTAKFSVHSYSLVLVTRRIRIVPVAVGFSNHALAVMNDQFRALIPAYLPTVPNRVRLVVSMNRRAIGVVSLNIRSAAWTR